jgi:hypothetical protein
LTDIQTKMETTELILLSITTLLGFYIAFVKSYVTEKGKNYATKQDIGEITRIVKEVEKQFLSDSEFLKNRLNLFSQSFHSIKTLERDALIAINTKYSDWLDTLTTFSLAFYNCDNYELLKDYYFIFSQKLKEFEVAEDNLHLYIHDEELQNILLELSQQTRELQKSVMTHISEFTTNCFIHNKKIEIAPQDQLVLLNTEYHKRQQPVIEKSIEDLIAIHKGITKPQISFIKILNYRIYQLIEER